MEQLVRDLYFLAEDRWEWELYSIPAFRDAQRLQATLEEQLSASDPALWNNFLSAVNQRQQLELEHAFRRGLRLGLLLSRF